MTTFRQTFWSYLLHPRKQLIFFVLLFKHDQFNHPSWFGGKLKARNFANYIPPSVYPPSIITPSSHTSSYKLNGRLAPSKANPPHNPNRQYFTLNSKIIIYSPHFFLFHFSPLSLSLAHTQYQNYFVAPPPPTAFHYNGSTKPYPKQFSNYDHNRCILSPKTRVFMNLLTHTPTNYQKKLCKLRFSHFFSSIFPRPLFFHPIVKIESIFKEDHPE